MEQDRDFNQQAYERAKNEADDLRQKAQYARQEEAKIEEKKKIDQATAAATALANNDDNR